MKHLNVTLFAQMVIWFCFSFFFSIRKLMKPKLFCVRFGREFYCICNNTDVALCQIIIIYSIEFTIVLCFFFCFVNETRSRDHVKLYPRNKNGQTLFALIAKIMLFFFRSDKYGCWSFSALPYFHSPKNCFFI